MEIMETIKAIGNGMNQVYILQNILIWNRLHVLPDT